MIENPTEKQSLRSLVIETKPVRWKDMGFIQQDDFKDLPAEARLKLKQSIISNEFTQPFYVWQDKKGELYCLDGKHRVMILEELQAENYMIPEQLPATFIRCKSKKEAARLVLVYSSIYAKITQQGLFDFIEMYDLQYDKLIEQVDIPEFSLDRFEQKFNLHGVDDGEESEVEQAEPVFVSVGDIFEINNHRVACGSFSNPELVNALMQGRKARILNCDPPYNLPSNFFSNLNHKDFAMAHGEMTDQQFVDFLAAIMTAAIDNSVAGAIHYIFMDWRHAWHITEAGRRVYGSAIPKQMCVWNKDLMANGSFYRSKHELCFVFSNHQAKALWNKDLIDHGGCYKDDNELVFIFKAGDDDVKHLSHLELADRVRSNVWDYPSATSLRSPERYELKNHPTPKPVQMIADAILDTTNKNDIVIDWFLGSGTCLISCDQTGRACYGTEIEPLYVQQMIQRYINYCEKQGKEIIFKHTNGSLTLKDFINAKSRPSEKNN
jgi:DNA modification methylase